VPHQQQLHVDADRLLLLPSGGFHGTTNPNHVAAGFPTDCSICHSTTNWTTSTFNHNTTAFPLTGALATIAMRAVPHQQQLHHAAHPATAATGGLEWNHQSNHAAAGFPTTCDTCHTTTDWTGATFNHNNTPFPLTGAHTTVACNLCHINNVFAGTPTDCYSCHQADFTGTTNPNHVTAGWPTTCTTCHTTTAWIPATLPASYHTFFPSITATRMGLRHLPYQFLGLLRLPMHHLPQRNAATTQHPKSTDMSTTA
jgi:predicted CXXCH cytochrome family protein